MAGAGAESASLLAAPKTKFDGAGEASASFFSAGFPKVNVGATCSLSACNAPSAGLTFGAFVVILGSPNLPNTDPTVVVVVVGAVAVVDVVSFGDATFSPLSCEKGGVKATEDEEVVVVCFVSSVGFESPKVKPPFKELPSVPDDPVPNSTPLLTPNLKPESVGWSDFLSSVEAVPNLKPPEELPNLNPDEPVVSLEEDSAEEFPDGIPNLNPPDEVEEDDSEAEVPNVKPPDPDVLSVVPNLKLPKVEVDEPEVDDPEGPPAEGPKEEPKAEEDFC